MIYVYYAFVIQLLYIVMHIDLYGWMHAMYICLPDSNIYIYIYVILLCIYIIEGHNPKINYFFIKKKKKIDGLSLVNFA